jgi:hypothetical protein
MFVDANMDYSRNILLEPNLICYNIYYMKQATFIIYIDLTNKIVFCYIIQVDKLYIAKLHIKRYYKCTYARYMLILNSYGRTYSGK